MSAFTDLEWLAKYGVTPDDASTPVVETAVAKRLGSAIIAADAALERFNDELAKAKKSGQLTNAGIKARAGQLGDQLLNDIAKWNMAVDAGRGALVDLDKRLTSTAVAGTGPAGEIRAKEVRDYLRGIGDALKVELALMDAIQDGDGEAVSAALDAPRILKLIPDATAAKLRTAWAERSNPAVVRERDAVQRLVKGLVTAINLLKAAIGKAVPELAEDPLQEMLASGAITVAA